MEKDQSELIKNALARAIKSATDNSLQTATQQLAAGGELSSSNTESQFPPFGRSTW